MKYYVFIKTTSIFTQLASCFLIIIMYNRFYIDDIISGEWWVSNKNNIKFHCHSQQKYFHLMFQMLKIVFRFREFHSFLKESFVCFTVYDANSLAIVNKYCEISLFLQKKKNKQDKNYNKNVSLVSHSWST